MLADGPDLHNHMKNGRKKWWVGRTVALIYLWLFTGPMISMGAVEETFSLLRIGTRTYTNVTVTTKTKTQIFIMHSTGMHTIKVADLPPELLAKFGYSNGPEQKTSKGLAALGTISKKSNVKFKLPDFKEFRKQLPTNVAAIQWSTNAALTFCGIVIVCYVFFCFCSMLICQKAGHPPGILIWIPVLQLVPLLRAAQMSPAWIIGFLLPGVNIIAQIVWSFNIAKARGKSPWTGLFLILPFTSIFAFLYLALSNGVPKKEAPAVEIMTLEAA
jgi:hypothetical protein